MSAFTDRRLAPGSNAEPLTKEDLLDMLARADKELGIEYFGDDDPGQTGNWGLAEPWTMHKRRTWADGATQMRHRIQAFIVAHFDDEASSSSAEEP